MKALICRSKTSAEIAEIAEIMAISRRTVEKHLERVFPKLGVETRTAEASVVRQFMD